MESNAIKDITGGWDHACLPHNVHVGEGCWLERKDSFKRFRSTREPGLVLGKRVMVYTWTEFNVEPTGLVEVGDDSVLAGAVFMCAESIRIGRRVIVSYNVTIADSDFHPRQPEARQLVLLPRIQPNGAPILRTCGKSEPDCEFERGPLESGIGASIWLSRQQRWS